MILASFFFALHFARQSIDLFCWRVSKWFHLLSLFSNFLVRANFCFVTFSIAALSGRDPIQISHYFDLYQLHSVDDLIPLDLLSDCVLFICSGCEWSRIGIDKDLVSILIDFILVIICWSFACSTYQLIPPSVESIFTLRLSLEWRWTVCRRCIDLDHRQLLFVIWSNW